MTTQTPPNPKFPVFDFNFQEIRQYIESINGIKDIIAYLEFVMEQYESQPAEFWEGRKDILHLLELERDYWKFISDGTPARHIRPAETDADAFEDLEWSLKFYDESVVKLYFQEWELFEFELEKIKEHAAAMSSLKSRIIYLQFVLKEFEIETTFCPTAYIKQQGGPFRQTIFKWIRTFERRLKGGVKNKDAAEAVNTSPKRSLLAEKEKSIEKFPSPPDLKWEEVSMETISLDSIKIKAREIIRTFHYVNLGFLDRRRKDMPDSRWEFLRDELARLNGKFNWQSEFETDYYKADLKFLVRDLRRRFKVIMGIDDDPFYSYRLKNAYQTKFRIKDSRPSNPANR